MMTVKTSDGRDAHVEYQPEGFGYAYAVSLVGVTIASGWVRVPDVYLPKNEHGLHGVLVALVGKIDLSEIA